MFKALVLVLLGVAIPSEAQVALAPSGIPIVNHIIDSRAKQNSLKCDVRAWSPFLDFNFRFQTGFLLFTNLGQFTPGEEAILYVRVFPEEASPVFLRESFDIPPVSPDTASAVDLKNLRKIEVTMSGAFNVGEGRYAVDLLLLNSHGRSCYKRWSLKTGKYHKQAIPLALQPQRVEPIVPASWDGKLDDKGVRLGVLLDAAPMNPYAPRLHAWDRNLLLEALASLLKQLPCQSVQIVAFNLEQQREIFRQENFDSGGFAKLAGALRHLELGSVPIQALQRRSAYKFVLQLAHEQISAQHPSDAVVFLGPLGRDQSIPKAVLDPASSRFFYFDYSTAPTQFPDAIERLTKNLRGTVFHISSANDLALAIHKMLAQLKPIQNGESVPERR